MAAVDADYVGQVAGLVQVLNLPPSLQEIVEHRAGLLVQYQGESLARDYRDFVAAVKAGEQAVKPGSTALAEAVARNLYKLMAYKDEYEVARLYTSGEFRKQLEATFEGDYSLQFHLAPPIFSRGLDEQGRPPEEVRGYGPVKAESVVRYGEQRAELLQRFHDPQNAVQIHATAGNTVGA